MDLVEPQSLHFHRHFSPECGMSSKSGDTLGVISDWTLVSTLVPADSHLQIGQTMAENAQTFLFTSTLLQTTVAICKTSQAIWGQNQIEKLAKSLMTRFMDGLNPNFKYYLK